MSSTGPVPERSVPVPELVPFSFRTCGTILCTFNTVLPEFDHQNVFCAHWYILEVGAPYVVMHNGSHMTLAPFKKVAAEGGDPSEY